MFIIQRWEWGEGKDEWINVGKSNKFDSARGNAYEWAIKTGFTHRVIIRIEKVLAKFLDPKRE